MIWDEFYKVEKVTERIQAIRCETGEIIFLLIGDDRALLLDSGVGIEGLDKVVASLTNLPVELLITHGHVDHANGAAMFESVYMNHADDEIYRKRRAIEERAAYMENALGAKSGSCLDAPFVKPDEPERFKNLEDGMVFDLGGLNARVYSLPGHTAGSMVVLIEEERILVTGDAANNFVFLFGQESETMETYRRNLQNLAEMLEGRYDRCFMMHRNMEASNMLLWKLIKLCDEIMRGETEEIPYAFMNRPCFVAKQFNEQCDRRDGEEGNIVYNKERLFD